MLFARLFYRPLLQLALACSISSGQSVVFPADAGVLNVTDFGVTPDDGIDDTAAIQAILDSTLAPPIGGGDFIIYFPDGVYDLSDTLQIPNPARFINLQGESRNGAILKLQDNLLDGSMAAFSGAMLNFAGGSADRFENSLRNLTLDIGAGNPSALGVQFNASNQGVARDLTIRSSDPNGAGAVGLDLGFDPTIGPLLVKNVSVDGFDVGIRSQFEANSKVLEDITVTNQNLYGWQNSNTATTMVRNFTSVNAVPAIFNAPTGGGDPGNGRLVLVGGSLTGVGDASTQPAIFNGNFVPAVYLRDITTSGYDVALNRTAQAFVGNTGLPDGEIEEYWFAGPSTSRRGGTFQLYDNSPDTMLGLPIQETPTTLDEPITAWVTPTDFGAVPDDGIDDTAAIQAAIDSGARTIYLPRGLYHVEGTVELRGVVERVVGAEASWISSGAGRVVLGENGADTVTIERVSGELGAIPRVVYEHASDRTWVFKNVSQWEYQATADQTGDLFLEDVVGGSSDEGTIFRNQNVWARQFNTEVLADTLDPLLPDAKVTVDNARLWVLGLKTERAGTIVRTINGGMTELLGVYRNGPGVSDADNPAFVTVEGATSVAVFSIRPNNDGYALFAAETRDGETRTAATFDRANVYSGFDAGDIWNVRQEVYLDNEDTVGFQTTGAWLTSSGFDGGFTGSDFLHSDDPGATATFTPELPVSGRYEIFARWVNDRGGQDHSGHDQSAPITIATATGDQTVMVDQDINGGAWISLGEFDLTGDGLASITLTVDGGGRVIADGARFVLVAPDLLPGDFNADGLVDAADYTVWRDTLGQGVPAFTGADADGDARVTQDDYQLWVINFGAMASAESSAVPEPGCLVAAACLSLVFSGRNRARR